MGILLVLIFSSIAALAQQSPSEFMTAWVAAYNKNDAKNIVSYYDHSKDTECLVSVGLWLKGYDEIKKMYHEDMKAVRFYDSKAEGMKHRLLGDVAVVSFIHKLKYLIRDTGEHIRVHIRTTATLKKDKDGWKIVSEHSSAIQGIERAKVIKKDEVNQMGRNRYCFRLNYIRANNLGYVQWRSTAGNARKICIGGRTWH